ncbi:MAG: DUF3185 domain-containing protein [Acidobacteria bacterium]|nr:DUF3185 domain-containing protein [Acidobacteriota bacterium]
MKILGIVLIVFGALMLAYQGITYTKNKTVIDLGPVEVQSEEKKTIPLPPIIGGLTLAGGIVLLIAGGGRHGS